jgi:Na+/proline symporter
LVTIGRQTAHEKLVLIPTEDLASLAGWLGVFAAGALGNLPGQDLMQRVFAARSAATARWACLIAGVMYLLFGTIPLVLALAADLLFPASVDDSILPALARIFLGPPVAVIFVVALLSAVLSTIDSAILSPAGVLAQNVLAKFSRGNTLRLNRIAVLIVALLSLGMAYWGENAYALLEEAYSLTLVGLFVPMMMGLYFTPRRPAAGGCSMLAGTVVWLGHRLLDWPFLLAPWTESMQLHIPIGLAATAISLAVYVAVDRLPRPAGSVG